MLALWSGAALACVLVSPPPFALDPDADGVDLTPPATPVVRSADLVRTWPSTLDPATCTVGFGSCDGYGWLVVEMESTDDKTPPEELGYRLVGLSGLPLPAEPLLAGNVEVVFDDSRGDSVDVAFQVVAVDRAGNESAPSAAISLLSPARVPLRAPCVEEGGCGGGGAAAGLLLLPGAGLVRRRRQAAGASANCRSTSLR